MRLDALTLDQCQRVREWRNAEPETTRTPYPLSPEQQAAFFRDVVCARNGNARYWAVIDDDGTFVGQGGLTGIQWENRLAEIALLIDPRRRRQGLGRKAAALLLQEGFLHVGLQTIWGECYHCNQGAVEFWRLIWSGYQRDRGKSGSVTIPNRKFHDGQFWPAELFSIDADDWLAVHRS